MVSADIPNNSKNCVTSAVWISTPIEPVTELRRAMMWSDPSATKYPADVPMLPMTATTGLVLAISRMAK